MARGSATANHRKDGVDIAILQHRFKLTVAGVAHQYSHLIPWDIKIINDFACGICFGQLSVFFDKPTFSKEGKELYLNLHECLKVPEGVDLFTTEIPNGIVRGDGLGLKEFRKTVIEVGKACGQVKGVLGF